MTWVYNPITELSPDGSHPIIIRDYFTNEEGVRIEIVGRLRKSLSVQFLYSTPDLEINFWARPGPQRFEYGDEKASGELYSLGSVCIIDIQDSDISRPLTASEVERIADNIVSTIREYDKFFLAKPPYPKAVVFSSWAKKALHLQD
jgi:hypothetical protein